jgi:hypothetical protein
MMSCLILVRLADAIPSESFNVPLLLGCVLAQVEKTLQAPPSTEAAPTETDSVAAHVTRVVSSAFSPVTTETVGSSQGHILPVASSGIRTKGNECLF